MKKEKGPAYNLCASGKEIIIQCARIFISQHMLELTLVCSVVTHGSIVPIGILATRYVSNSDIFVFYKDNSVYILNCI